jgi:hypothetical protein
LQGYSSDGKGVLYKTVFTKPDWSDQGPGSKNGSICSKFVSCAKISGH